MRIRVDKAIVPYKFTHELVAAGVPALRVALLPKNGLYIELENEDDRNLYLDTILAVIDAHDGIDEIGIEETQAQENLKAEYQNALDTLITIRDADPGNITNAQAVAAIQYIAKILVFLLKYLVRRLVG